MAAHLKYGPAIRNLILHWQFELSYIYEEPLKHFDENTAIRVENIRVDILEYEKASHILVPLNPPKLKMFKIERQYPGDCRKSREDAFRKTVKWISDL